MTGKAEPGAEPPKRARGAFLCLALTLSSAVLGQIGSEVAVPAHLQDGQEFTTSLGKLLKFGKSLFTANWTIEEGGGRPETKGTGAAVSDPGSPLLFPRNF